MVTEPDSTLEVALEAVLARHKIPLFNIGPYDADRGDLASDLAAAARTVGPLPDPDGYEAELGRLYARLRTIYEEHEEHSWDSHAHPPFGGKRTCGGPSPNDRCNPLGDLLYDAIEEAFPPEQVERWLSSPPAANWLEWGTADGVVGGEGRLRDFVAGALWWDAQCRLGIGEDGLVPADPATMRPEDPVG